MTNNAIKGLEYASPEITTFEFVPEAAMLSTSDPENGGFFMGDYLNDGIF